MRIRLVFLVACLLPSAGECAAPVVECRQGQAAFEMLEAARKAVTSTGPEVDLGLMRPVEWKAREKVRVADVGGSEGPASTIERPPYSFDFMTGWDRVVYRRHLLDEPLALPLADDGPQPVWAYRFDPESLPVASVRYIDEPERTQPIQDIFQPDQVPSVSLDSRRLILHLGTSGVGPWDTAITEVWLTRDGWTWHRYQSEQHCDSHVVTLPSEGRYGLRVVVQDVDGPASTTLAGDTPQLWIDVDETLPVVGTPKRRVVGGDVYLYHESRDLRGETKPTKPSVMGRPHAEIVRVDAEKVKEPSPFEGAWFISGWTR